jgi:hypothetical protein
MGGGIAKKEKKPRSWGIIDREGGKSMKRFELGMGKKKRERREMLE